MAKVTTIFWDIGGVVLTNGWDEKQRRKVLPRFDVDVNEYDRRHEAANALWERGRSTRDEYLDAVLFYQPREFTRDEIWEAIEGESRVLTPEWFGLAEKLHGAGKYRMGTLNNESRELNDFRLTKFNLRDWFDLFLCSGYAGMMKPEPGIFRLALDVSQAGPAETLFVDDKATNVAAAQALGMQGICFTGYDALAAEMRGLGLEV